MFGTLGGPELFLIFVVALIVFGPRKLPEIGKSLGKMMGEFRRASNEFRSTIESEVEAEKIRDVDADRAPEGRAGGAGRRRLPVHGVPAGPEAEAASEPAAAPEPAPTPQPAEETVSRQPDDTPIEPK